MTAKLGGARPLARDSDEDQRLSLGNRHGERKLQHLPKMSSCTKLPRAARFLSLASTAVQEEEEQLKAARETATTPAP
jgi:hypothetical protein